MLGLPKSFVMNDRERMWSSRTVQESGALDREFELRYCQRARFFRQDT